METGRARRIVVCLGGLALAACSYKPGSFHAPLRPNPFLGERVTVGCLDVAVLARASSETGQVVEVSFGNRCDRATVIDFAALRATGRDGTGAERALAVFDPNHELRPLMLEARLAGREVIELQTTPAPHTPVVGMCLDVAALAHDPGGERWLCVAPGPVEAVATTEPASASAAQVEADNLDVPLINPEPSPVVTGEESP